MVGLQGPSSAAWRSAPRPVDFDHGSALLITGVEIIPTLDDAGAALRRRRRLRAAAAGAAVPGGGDHRHRQGRPHHLPQSPAAEPPHRQRRRRGRSAKLLEDIVSLVDENRPAAALGSRAPGAPTNWRTRQSQPAARPCCCRAPTANERSIELFGFRPSATAPQELIGAVGAVA